MNSGNTRCAQCGFVIGDESPSGDPAHRKPCPQCGSTARDSLLSASVTVHASVSADLTVVTYPQTLLSTAQTLIEGGQFGIATVVCHMACEVAVERSLSAAFASKGLQYLEDAVEDLLNGYNLANSRIRVLYSALTGDAIELQDFWQQFKESAKRRNEIIHKSRVVTKAEAMDSHQAASAVVSHLKK